MDTHVSKVLIYSHQMILPNKSPWLREEEGGGCLPFENTDMQHVFVTYATQHGHLLLLCTRILWAHDDIVPSGLHWTVA